MITFYLVRHASYTEKYHLLPGRLPVELSDEGKVESQKLQKYFEDKDISQIYSSAVLRCKQTVEIISNGKIPIVYDKRLLEILSPYQGFWVPDAWDQFWGHKDELGGETEKEATNRVLDFFFNTGFEDGKKYIICSHGDPLYYIYQKVGGVPPLPEVKLGDKVVAPADYQKRASVRIVTKDVADYKVEDTINPDDL